MAKQVEKGPERQRRGAATRAHEPWAPRVGPALRRRMDASASPRWAAHSVGSPPPPGPVHRAHARLHGLAMGPAGHASCLARPQQASWPRRALWPATALPHRGKRAPRPKPAKPQLAAAHPVRRCTRRAPPPNSSSRAKPAPPNLLSPSLLLPRRRHTTAWPPDTAATGHQQHRRPVQGQPAAGAHRGRLRSRRRPATLGRGPGEPGAPPPAKPRRRRPPIPAAGEV
jgi:hypothetical protein